MKNGMLEEDEILAIRLGEILATNKEYNHGADGEEITALCEAFDQMCIGKRYKICTTALALVLARCLEEWGVARAEETVH